MKMGYCKVLLKTQDCLLLIIEHELRSTGLELVPFLATRLLYQEGIEVTWGLGGKGGGTSDNISLTHRLMTCHADLK